MLNQANKGKQFGLEKKKEKRTNYKYSLQYFVFVLLIIYFMPQTNTHGILTLCCVIAVLVGGGDSVRIPDTAGTNCSAAAASGQWAARTPVQRVCRLQYGQDCYKGSAATFKKSQISVALLLKF